MKRLRSFLRKKTVVVEGIASGGLLALRAFRAPNWGGRTLVIDVFGRIQAQVDLRLGDAWFRLWGYGLSVKDVRDRKLLFSDRNMLGARLRVGPLLLQGLAPTSTCRKGPHP